MVRALGTELQRVVAHDHAEYSRGVRGLHVVEGVADEHRFLRSRAEVPQHRGHALGIRLEPTDVLPPYDVQTPGEVAQRVLDTQPRVPRHHREPVAGSQLRQHFAGTVGEFAVRHGSAFEPCHDVEPGGVAFVEPALEQLAEPVLGGQPQLGAQAPEVDRQPEQRPVEVEGQHLPPGQIRFDAHSPSLTKR